MSQGSVQLYPWPQEDNVRQFDPKACSVERLITELAMIRVLQAEYAIQGQEQPRFLADHRTRCLQALILLQHPLG